MKKSLAASLSFLAGLLVLSGCAGSSATADHAEAIQIAADKNAELQNGRFEKSIPTENDPEELGQVSEGAFIKAAEGQYDWYEKITVGENSTTEQAQVDGSQYKKITVPEQPDLPWMEAPSGIPSLQEVLAPLFESNLAEAEIAKSEILETGDTTQYTFTMNDDYAERIRQENVEALQQTIEHMEQSNFENAAIQGVKDEMAIREETHFQDNLMIYEVDEAGFLIAFRLEGTIVRPDEEPLTLVSSVTLTEYNLSDPEGLFPPID